MQLTSVKKEKLQKSLKYSVPEGKRKKMKQSRNNRKHFLKNANIFTRHCACDIYVVLLQDFSNNI